MLQENDISWQMLRQIVHDWSGTSAELEEVKPLVGGCINTTLALRTRDGQRAVLKITPHRIIRTYQEEAYQLNLLREVGLPTPEVYVCRIGSLEDPFSYLLMQHMDGVNLAEAKQQCSEEQFEHLQMHLADLVLRMHERTSDQYRRIGDGSGPTQPTWVKFYHQVYDPIWQETAKLGLIPVKPRKQIDKIHDRLERLIGHSDCPRLLHGDLWSTNILAKADEQGRWWVTAILDPNCKFSHFEVEIAYTELFHTVTPAFLRAYQQTHRLPPEYHRVRKLIYQLYPMIDHVRLFGHEYLKPLLGYVEKAAALV